MSEARTPVPMAWPWRDAPLVRVVGAFVSWGAFVMFFALLFLTALTVIALGGSCASGGPYVIEVECPANVAIFAPISILGGFLAVGLSLLFAQGFAAPIAIWAWPILFVGLSIPFFIGAAAGDIGGAIIGVLFAVMGLVPLWLLLKQGEPWLLFLGGRDVHGHNFVSSSARPRSGLLGRRPGADIEPVRPSGGDWVLALGVVGLAVATGLVAARALWTAGG